MMRVIVIASFLLTAGVLLGGDDAGTMILAGKVFDGEKVTENRTLFLKGGRIVETLDLKDVPSLDAGDQWVLPGLVDATTSLGLSGSTTEKTTEVSPRFSIASELNPDDPVFGRALASGVTVAYVAPGTDNVVSGFGAILRHDGHGFRIADERAALEMTVTADPTRGNRAPRRRPPRSIYYRRPTTRMGVVWIVRRALFAAASDDADPDVQVVREALAAGRPIRFTARREEDIRGVCRLAREFGLTGFTVSEAHDAWRVADELRERKANAVLPPVYYSTSGYGPDRLLVHLSGAAELAKRGVPFAIATGSDGTGLREAAGLARRFGLSRDRALAAITSAAARVLGIADRAGSIRTGRPADLVFFDGDPLEPTSRVVRVMVGGKTVYEDSK